jgi:hypothetical protein
MFGFVIEATCADKRNVADSSVARRKIAICGALFFIE